MPSPSKSTPHHLISLADLSPETIQVLLDKAQGFAEDAAQGKPPEPLLAHRKVVNLFCENSTRTRVSFELAAKSLGAVVVTLPYEQSSAKKGEALEDTVANLAAMGCDTLVLRHSSETVHKQLVAENIPGLSVVSAGAGSFSHPTQGLLDLLTIRQHKGWLNDLSVAIVGDTRHSRVTRSLVTGLNKMGTTDIRLVGPQDLLLDPAGLGVECQPGSDLRSGLDGVDVVVALRIQRERMDAALIPSEQDYFKQYGVTEAALKNAKPDVVVMHPGPMNRDVDIASSVADGPRSAILQQTRNGVFVRMATLLGSVTETR